MQRDFGISDKHIESLGSFSRVEKLGLVVGGSRHCSLSGPEFDLALQCLYSLLVLNVLI